MRPLWIAKIIFWAALSGCTCGGEKLPPNGTDGGLVELRSIAVTPENPVLTIRESTAATQSFTAIGTFADGHTEDLSSRVSWTLDDPSLGAFSGNHFTSTIERGGVVTLRAEANQLSGTTRITLVLQRTKIDPGSIGVPSDPGSWFTGAPEQARKPELVYPNDGVLVPPNLGKLEFHFAKGAGNTLWELSFTSPVTELKVYLSCPLELNGGCIYLPDPQLWSWLAENNRGGSVTVTLRGSASGATSIGVSDPITVAFAYEAVNGGLYYWTTTREAIMRFDFGSVAASSAQQFLFTNNSKASIFESWSPDGANFVGVFADNGSTDFRLKLFDGNNGAYLSSIPGTGEQAHPADHPDWSPDGTQIAYARIGSRGTNGATNQRMFRGSIQRVTKESSGTWSSPATLVEERAGTNSYYPAFAPNNRFLVLNQSTCPSGDQHRDCNADTDPSASLVAVLAEPGNPVIALTKANAPGKTDGAATQLTNSYPKWSPFIFQRTEIGSRLMWMTFSSSRNYGLRSPPPGGTENPKGSLLWMVAIDPDKVEQGVDPSFPAFALPFQELTTSNHIAQWTTKVIPPIN
jgi:hypothetical protein